MNKKGLLWLLDVIINVNIVSFAARKFSSKILLVALMR